MLGPTSLPGNPLATMPGPDLMGKEAARGTCHKCGGSLSRGNSDLAKQCGACGTRFHMSDCGGRLAAAGYHEEFDQCPKVRQPEPMLSDLANAPPDPDRPRQLSAPVPPSWIRTFQSIFSRGGGTPGADVARARSSRGRSTGLVGLIVSLGSSPAYLRPGHRSGPAP